MRYGDPGQPGFPAAATFTADQVIADLSPEMPNPATPKLEPAAKR